MCKSHSEPSRQSDADPHLPGALTEHEASTGSANLQSRPSSRPRVPLSIYLSGRWVRGSNGCQSPREVKRDRLAEAARRQHQAPLTAEQRPGAPVERSLVGLGHLDIVGIGGSDGAAVRVGSQVVEQPAELAGVGHHKLVLDEG
eukprot:scaffold41804_cov63-Phaeocystis_antarctica.AAC.2